MDLREASSADAQLLLNMMDDFNRLEDIHTAREQISAALNHLLRDATLGRAFVLTHEGAVVGYAVLTFGYDLEFAGRDAFLTELYLVPSARGRGWGRSAVALLETQARALGVHAIHLVVRHENAPARRLYEAAGFVTPPRLLMSKRLVPLT